jgi:hypothetical protein
MALSRQLDSRTTLNIARPVAATKVNIARPVAATKGGCPEVVGI